MKLAQVLDVIEGVLIASEHPDIASVERYGTSTEPWGPNEAQSRARSVSGVRVRYSSTSTASIWGAVNPGAIPVPIPDEMPPISRRATRLPIFVVQLLNVARPSDFASWQLVALADVGPTGERGTAPVGVSVVCADGTTMLLLCTATGATLGAEPEEDPFPDYVIPEGVKEWHLKAAALSVERK